MSHYQIQVLPISYNSGELLARYMKEVLGNDDFEIEGFLYNQWRVKVPNRLSESDVQDLKTKMRKHYATT
ncbi:Uu.00g039970.m01.CDS01 [Anthostomella pinea]|uniref:Uu.00g039970.m01.CDS01 n=1 Tax=Anthostomella pinea TaxID=933095 RepID=A0AAI8V9Z5_9PEZI|nr:Uu.00g039970.m01.CDS01 [Anthostomella pinea]